MRILYEADLAGSKYHGMAYRIFQFSERFKKKGNDIVIVAASYSHVRHTNPQINGEITEEVIGEVPYCWIKTPSYNGNGIGRAIHQLLYSLKLFTHARQFARKFSPDVVISSGVTPFESFGCKRIAKIAGAKMIYEVGDLWPLTPIELGGFSKWHPYIKMMQIAEDYAYRNCDAVVSLLPCAESYMRMHGLSEGKFHYIPNGVITEEWDESSILSEECLRLIQELRNNHRLLIGYAGSLSLANSLSYAIEAFGELNEFGIDFIIVGKGPEEQKLKSMVHLKHYSNVHFLPAMSKVLIPAFLSRMDVLYVGFRKQSLYRFGISPNKIFDYMMAGKPIIQAINAGNDLTSQAQCGISVEAENGEEIKRAALKIKEMKPEERKLMGQNGKEYVMRNHSYDYLVEEYLKILK